ncbi:MAG: ExbD/TolR family protein [Pseudomonadota bacterium]
MMGGAAPAAGARRARSRRATLRPMSEINVTPFVDVMLVLLIIFMVAAPLLTVGVPLELSRTDAPSLPDEATDPLTVSIDPSGQVFIQEAEVQPGSLRPRLDALAALNADVRVYLRADAALPHGVVADVLDELSLAGFRRIALVNAQRGPDDG